MRKSKYYLILNPYEKGKAYYAIFCSEKVSKFISEDMELANVLDRKMNQISGNKYGKTYNLKIKGRTVYLKCAEDCDFFYAYIADEYDFLNKNKI